VKFLPGIPGVKFMVARVGFSATINRESRQARKGATVTVISGAGEVPARAASIARGVRRFGIRSPRS